MEFECSQITIKTLPSGRLHVTASDAAPADEQWNKQQCAKFLNVSIQTLQNYMRRDGSAGAEPIPHSKSGRFPRFSRKAVEGWLERDAVRRRTVEIV
jgi:hypothetical protein